MDATTPPIGCMFMFHVAFRIIHHTVERHLVTRKQTIGFIMASTNGGSTKSNVAPSGASLSIGSKTGTNHRAIVYMILLAIQFGIQPIISRRYTSPTINKSTVLLVQEIVKFIMAYMMLLLSGNTSNVMKGAPMELRFKVFQKDVLHLSHSAAPFSLLRSS